MNKLTTQLGGQRGCLGLSLRGSCITAADAQKLAQVAQQLLTTQASTIWIDCQQLHTLSPLGQQALVQADGRARAVGTTYYWCGLPDSMLARLAGSGLELRPATEFQGPGFLLSGASSQALA